MCIMDATNSSPTDRVNIIGSHDATETNAARNLNCCHMPA